MTAMLTPLRLVLSLSLAATFIGCDSTGRFDFNRSSRDSGYRPETEPFFRGREVRDRRDRRAPDRREEAPRDRREESTAETRSTPAPATSSRPDATPTPKPSPTPSFLPTPAPRTTSGGAPAGSAAEVRYGVPVPGKPGYVTSPYSPDAGYVDVTGLAPGSKAKDPYSGKVFLVP